MAKGIMYVDNIRVEFDDEPTILDVCRKAGVEMPNFCFHSDLSVYGACRMCMVEDLDTGKIDAACTTKPKNGMRIRTNMTIRTDTSIRTIMKTRNMFRTGWREPPDICSTSARW